MKKITLSVTLAASIASAGGYKVPEQSADSAALLASNVAMSFGADAAYFNPANMMFLDSRHHIEGTLGWFHIDEIGYKASDGNRYQSRKFDSMAGTFSFVSPEKYENWRFGLALAVPAALGMAWADPQTSFTAKRFKLQVVELNPTVAYRVTDQLAVAAGARVLYTKGIVASNFGAIGDRYLEGDSIDYGYNVALTYRPIENLSLAATYRSKVDLTVKGDAQGRFNALGPIPALNYDGAVSVQIPLPAQLVLAAGYKFNDLTLLLAFERTYWSKFKGYDFDYPDGAHRSHRLFANFMDAPTTRHYKDANTYRVGVAYEATDRLRLMAGFSYDEDVSQSNDTGFELPNTTSRAYGLGLNYKMSDALELALGYVYQDRQKKTATGIPSGYSPLSGRQYISGEFERGSIQIVGVTAKYSF